MACTERFEIYRGDEHTFGVAVQIGSLLVWQSPTFSTRLRLEPLTGHLGHRAAEEQVADNEGDEEADADAGNHLECLVVGHFCSVVE
jgi:hypothetical protein